jgi:ABC-type antimicrobial peptide transport system permease subunit
VSKKVFLVFGLITIVVGGLLSFIFGFLLMFALQLEAEYPSPGVAPGFFFALYFWLTIGIILICVGILLLILSARRKA